MIEEEISLEGGQRGEERRRQDKTETGQNGIDQKMGRRIEKEIKQKG